MRRTRVACALALCACALASQGARADTPEPFGTAGQWTVGGSAGGFYAREQTQRDPGSSPEMVDVEHWDIWISPSTLHFVTTDVALGGSFSLGKESSERGDGFRLDAFHYGASALVAFRIGLGARLLLLPQLGFGPLWVIRSGRGPSTPSVSASDAFERFAWRPLRNAWAQAYSLDTTALRATLSVPLAVSPTPGLLLGFGPYVNARYALDGVVGAGADDWAIAVGIGTLVGFWL